MCDRVLAIWRLHLDQPRSPRRGRLARALFLVLPLCVVGLRAQEAAAPHFEDGMAQKVEAFSDPGSWVRHHLWVETSFDSDGDGKPDRMHVDVTRPEQTESAGLKVPVIYETSPYYFGTGTNGPQYFWDPHHELGAAPPHRTPLPPIKYQGDAERISRSYTRQWVPRGFAVVHSCSPGTGRSQGCPTVGGENESLAPKAVIDWLNGRAKGYTAPVGGEEVKATWSTGKVGMIGTSYNGTLPLAAATTGVEGLEAIVPVAPNTSYYHYYRSNGLVRHPGGYMGEDIDVLYDFINSGNPERREYCNCKVRDEDLQKHQDRVTGDYSEWWAARDYLNKVDKVKAATLMAHAFNDWNVMPEHSVRIYEALKARGVPAMAYFHQGDHGGDPPFDLINRWFTRYLYGVKNGVEELPRSWIVREGASQRDPTPYPDYPHPEAKPVTLFPAPGGEAAGALAFTAVTEVQHERIIDDASISGRELARAENSPHRLMYATAPLKQPVHLSGTSRLKVRLSVNKPAANFSVWVVSLPWTKRRITNSDLITRGWADPQNHASLTKSEPLVPGAWYDLDFTLQPDDQIIPAGERIGIMLFSSDRNFTLRPKPGTEILIDLEHTSITMPVVGGEKALKAALH